MLRGKLNSMGEYLSNAELETKASRETITRLVSEAEREQRVTTKFTMEMDKIRAVSLAFTCARICILFCTRKTTENLLRFYNNHSQAYMYMYSSCKGLVKY